MPPNNLPYQRPKGLLIIVAVLVLGLIGVGAFAVWAFNGRQVYKTQTDQKIATAVGVAQKATQAADAQQYAQAAENPLKTYNGPEAYGSLAVNYPKNWSAYVAITTSTSGGNPVDGYFQPDVVPNVQDPTSTYALRVQVVPTSYDQVLAPFNALAQQGMVKVASFSFAKVPSVVGVRIDGQIEQNKQGSMILLPLRDKTLKVWTESSQYLNDFNNNILPNFSFSP